MANEERPAQSGVPAELVEEVDEQGITALEQQLTDAESTVVVDPDATVAEPADEAPADGDEAVDHPVDPTPSVQPVEPWDELVAAYEGEANARGEDPSAARLWFEAGLIHEIYLDAPRQAAVCYQTAFKLDRTYRPNLQAARRLFAGVGNWTIVATLLDAEADATEDASTKAMLLYERATLLQDRLGKPAEAEAVIATAASLQPNGLPILRYQEDLAARAGDWAKLADVYAREALAVTSAPMRVALLCGAAGLYADRLGDTSRATDLYQQAHQADPRHPVPIEALQRLFASSTDEMLLAILEADASAAANPGDAAAALHQAARYARDKLGRPDESARLMERAREVAPDDPTVLWELADAYELGQQWEPLAQALNQLASITTDPRALAEILHRLGVVYDEHLQREPEAAATFRKMLDVTPGSPDALAALGKLYFRSNSWDDLIWTFEQELEATKDPKQRAMRLFKVAEIQEQQQEKPEEAIATLRRVLEESPGYLPASQSLHRLFQKAGRWEDLIGLYESELSGAEDQQQKVYILEKICRLREERLEDIASAIEGYERIIEIAPDHLPTVRRLASLFGELEKWPEQIRMIERESELVDDQRQVIALLHQTCEILETKVDDRDAAIEAYRRVLKLQPSYLPGLKALGKLYLRKGKWDELIEMHRMEIEVTTSTDHVVALLLRTADIYESKVLDEEKAISTYREVLEQKPDCLPALRALGRMYGLRGDWDKVVDVIRREADVMTNPVQKALLLCRAAEVRENRSHHADKAAELYLEALGYRPDHHPALRALARLYGTAGAWRELASVYERVLASAPPEGRVRSYRHLAHLYLDRLDEPAKAMQCLESVLSEEEDDVVALNALERLYTAQKDHSKAIGIRVRLAAQAEGDAAGILHSAAFAREHLEEPPTSADALYRSIYEMTPNDPIAARRVETYTLQSGDWPALLKLYREERERAPGNDLRLALSMRIADTALNRLGQSEVAEAAYREALEVDPTHLPAIRGLKNVLIAADKWDEVQSLLVREGEASKDPDRSVALLFEAGMLLEQHQGDLKGAEENYRRVLERKPLDSRAHERLAKLIEDGERWAELATLHEQRATQQPTATEQAEAWLGAADVYEKRIGDKVRALEAVDRALAADPNHGAALERAGDLAYDTERWEQAAAFYTRRVEAGGDPARLVETRLRLGELYRNRLGDFQRANAYFQDVLKADASNPQALRQLADLHRTSGNWAGAASTLTRMAEVEQNAQLKIPILLELAEIHATRHQDQEAAVKVLEELRALDPHNVQAVETLGKLYEARQDWDKVISTYDTFIELLPAGERSRAAPLYLRMAEIQIGHLNDEDKALASYRAAIDLDPETVEPRIALAQIYGRNEATAPQAIIEHRELLKRNPLRIDSYHALFTLFETQKAFDKLYCVAAVLQFLKASNQDEAFFYTENKAHAASDTTGVLQAADHANGVRHPDTRGPLADVLEVIGNQLGKVHPPPLAQYQVSKGDRISPKDGSPLRKLCDGLLAALGGGEYDLYRADKAGDARVVLAADPHAVVVSSAVIRRHPVKEQRFFLGQLMEQVRSGSALVMSLDVAALTASIQGCVQAVVPEFQALAPADPAFAKKCQKSMSRKARKALEEPARRLSQLPAPDLERFTRGVALTLDRAGMVLSGDPEACLRLIAANAGHTNLQNPPEELFGVDSVNEALRFAISEEHFRLRGLLGMGIG